MGGLSDGSSEDRIRSGTYVRRGNHVQQDQCVGIDGRELVIWKWVPGIWIDGAIGSRIADVVEISVAIGDGRHKVVEVLRNVLTPPVLQPEDERVVLPDRPANTVAEVVLLVAGFRSTRNIEVVMRVERFIAGEFPQRSVEGIGA